jgi:hypothetical protein
LRKASIDAVVSAAVLALLFAAVLALPRSLSWLPDVAQRLGATSELISAALVIAILAGWLLSFVRIGWLLLVLRSIPFFWIAMVSTLLAARAFQEPFGYSGFLGFSVPAVVLALFVLPNAAAFDFKKPGADLIVSGLQCIVARLPQLIAADFLVEIFFAWPGEARGFFFAIQMGLKGRRELGEAIAVVLVASMIVILLRWLVGLLALRLSIRSAS